MSKIFRSVREMVGNTPIVHLEGISNLDLFIKLEGNNPTGSVKDRAALAMIEGKIKKGELEQGKTILDASSGSFACSIAYFGHIMSYPVKVITTSKLTADKRSYIEYFGASNEFHGDFTIEGNRYCADLYSEKPDKYCFIDQLHNWDNPNTHYNITGPEIMEALPYLDAIIFSLGSGGTLCGVGKFFKEHRLKTRIIAITAESGTKIPGVGGFDDGDYQTPFILDAYDNNYIDYTVKVDIDDATDRLQILRDQGFYLGVQSGAVYHGMLESVKALGITGSVLIISGDAGWKNTDQLKRSNYGQKEPENVRQNGS